MGQNEFFFVKSKFVKNEICHLKLLGTRFDPTSFIFAYELENYLYFKKIYRNFVNFVFSLSYTDREKCIFQ